MSSFYHRLDQKILEAKLSYRDLSLRIGKGETYVSTMIRNRNDPGLSTVVDMCRVLGIHLNDLLDDGEPERVTVVSDETQKIEKIVSDVISAMAGKAQMPMPQLSPGLSIDEIMAWWSSHDGRLENMDKILEHIDLYSPPDGATGRPVPARLGNESLAAKKLQLHDEDNFRHLFEEIDSTVSSEIAASHREALIGKPVLTVEHLNLAIPDAGVKVKTDYNRLLLPVRDFARNRFVLNYSQPISQL